MSLLYGARVTLRPTTPEEISQFFTWATNPDPEVQRYYYGENVPTYEEFLAEWAPHYFDDEQPTQGRCYTILAGGETPVGVVNYNEFDPAGRRVTFDIVIGQRENLGQGYGSDALRTLVRYLFARFPTLETGIIGAHPDNGRAIGAYRKAGFRPAAVDVSDPYIAGYDEEPAALFYLEIRREDVQSDVDLEACTHLTAKRAEDAKGE
jgi:RimJ/RimL family protein N-acetyltransferase